MHARLTGPIPVDMPLPGRPREIAIYLARGALEVDHCTGSDLTGRCPRPHADGTVACAGCIVVLPAAVRGSRAWEVPLASRECPVGTYAAYRHA